MAFKYSYLILSTNFDLEPVIEQYAKTYPEADLQNYQVAFKGKGDFHPDNLSYIIVFEYHAVVNGQPTFIDYLNSYCLVHRLVVSPNAGSSVFPDISKEITRITGKK